MVIQNRIGWISTKTPTRLSLPGFAREYNPVLKNPDFIADFLDFFKGNLKKSGLMDCFKILYFTLPKSPKITF